MHWKTPPDRWWSRRAAAVVVADIRHQGGRFVGGILSGGYPKEMGNTPQNRQSWLCRRRTCLPVQSGVEAVLGGGAGIKRTASPRVGSEASTQSCIPPYNSFRAVHSNGRVLCDSNTAAGPRAPWPTVT